MVETVTPQEVLEAAKAEQARRDETWAGKMIGRGTEERGRAEESEAAPEAEPERVMRSQEWDTKNWVQINPEGAGSSKEIVDLDFKKVPETGKLLKVVKPGSFGTVYSVEEPRGGGKEDTVYLRRWMKGEIEDRLGKKVPEDMDMDKFLETVEEIPPLNEYLTDETLEKLGIPQTETQPEALPLAA